jgi:Mg-chelatase subunit ChlD
VTERRDRGGAALRVSEQERLRRWRLVLGGGEADGTDTTLRGDDRRVDGALGALYDREARRGRGSGRAGGLARSAPSVSRWLGDIRRYFPTPVVQVLQRDAIERLALRELLLEPELLGELEPDLHLVTMLVELNRELPEATRAAARQVVAQVLAQLEARLADRTRQAVHGALARARRTRRPRPADIDWVRTIRSNLRHWVPEHRTVVPEHLVGFGRHQRSLARDLIIAVDQSGSMAASIVHASLFACVLARLPALRTSLVVFDTAVADLTPVLADPVDVLFGVQLGGGTDIGAALGYCRRLVSRPPDSVLLLISDLFEGGNVATLRTRVAELVRDGVTVVVLLALSDDGVPAYDHHEAAALSALGAAVVACTPDAFPELLAAALAGRAGPDLARWAAERGLTTA